MFPPAPSTLMKHTLNNRWKSGGISWLGLRITIVAVCLGLLAWGLKTYHDEQEVRNFKVPSLTGQ